MSGGLEDGAENAGAPMVVDVKGGSRVDKRVDLWSLYVF
jgi:hypothetical protein